MLATLERKPLGQLLIDRGLVSEEQLAQALVEQRKSHHEKLLGEVLVELNICSEDQVTEALAQAYGVPYARVSPRLTDPKIISILPKEFLEKHQVLPLFLVEGVLTVAVSEPANVFLLEEIERLTNKTVQVVAATARDIKSTLQSYLPNDKMFVIDELIDDVESQAFTLLEAKPADAADLAQAAGDSPVVKLVNYCIYTAVKEQASDVHIEPHEQQLRVRYRIDGRLIEKLRPPPQMSAAVVSRVKIMASLDITQRHLPQDGTARVMLDGRPIDLRVHTAPGRHGETVVIRIVDNERAPARLEKLGFNYDMLKALRKALALPSGMLLVTGPAGSGKSTTLAAALLELNRDDLNICTVEEPIAQILPGVNQFEVQERNGFSYSVALASVLRQDPDIVMVGELRDRDTARQAAQAALTGQLILSTLHTTDTASAITRLFDLGVEPYVVSATLGGVLAQRLVRKLCQSCKESYSPTLNERRQIEKHLGNNAGFDTLYRPKGCERCRNIGYTGRIGVYELLIPDDRMVERISQAVPLNELRELARKTGMKPLRTDGVEKVKSGITTLDETFRVTS
jgi:type IV pilus assembly protein PilB